MHLFRSNPLPDVSFLLLLQLGAIGIAVAQPEASISADTALRFSTLRETIRTHPVAGRLNDTCRSRWDVHACTDFVRERFACRCELRDGGWLITADVDLEAVIHVVDLRYVRHEQLHLADVRARLRHALDRYLTMRFNTESGCAAVAGVMSSPSFMAAVMNRLRTESNARYGCTTKTSAMARERRPIAGKRAAVADAHPRPIH